MQRATKRIGVFVGAAAISATLLGVGGVATAAPANHPTIQGSQPGAHPDVASIIGTKNLYLNYGSGFTEDGTMTINSNGTWSESNYSDSGYWVITGKDAILSNTVNDTVYFAKIGKHGLGSAKKPGTETHAGSSTPSLPFYTLG